MRNLHKRVKTLEECLMQHEKGPKQYFVTCEQLTEEEWNDYIKNPDKWITVLPDEEPEGYFLKLKHVRLP
jgi:hypothetical protein